MERPKMKKTAATQKEKDEAALNGLKKFGSMQSVGYVRHHKNGEQPVTIYRLEDGTEKIVNDKGQDVVWSGAQ